jgi:nicotinamide mononucleotide transporter
MVFLFDPLYWINSHLLEIIAVITGLLYVVYTIRKNIRLWIFGTISSALYVWIFYQSALYAYGTLYIYYVVMGIYGWYQWRRKVTDNQGRKVEPPVRSISGKFLLRLIVISLGASLPVFLLLRKYNGDQLALADALLTASGMVATWMLTQKMIAQWLFWIVIDLLSMGVMIYKGLYPSAILFLVYALLALKGYNEWKKEIPVREAT